MSSSPPSIVSWALPRLGHLLPLDDESLTQIISYTTSLSKHDGTEHLKNLLGDSPAALEFISSFNVRRNPIGKDDEGVTGCAESGGASPAVSVRGAKQKGVGGRRKAPLHSPGPPRRPEGFGNVAGGYVKTDHDEDYMASNTPARGGSSVQVDGGSASGHLFPKAKVSGSPYLSSSSAASSRNHSPASKATKAPPSASGPLISDYLPNVRSKTAKMPSATRPATSSPFRQTRATETTSTTTQNIADLTAAIAALEVSTNPTLAKERRKCNCNATLHPLFTAAPNCLNCGKIICALEGPQPCSFCGAPVLSSDEVQGMIRELRAERGNEKMRAHNESLQHSDSRPGLGQNIRNSNAPASSNNKLDAARAHRDKLLTFQAQNTQRTRVVDEAADFETPNVASTQWMNPTQRALALKKQQRILREMEEKARPEWERESMVMSLDIKGGKVIKSFRKVAAETRGVEVGKEEQESELEEAGGGSEETSTRGVFSWNPLLRSGGLVRPVWKAPGAEEGVVEQRNKQDRQTWRRVQDDDEDNEKWILDGGLHGYESYDGAQHP